MKISTALAVLGLAIFFILILVLEIMSAPTAEDNEDGTEKIPPLTREQERYQFASKMCFYGILGMVFTIVITALESCN
tara:strand:+ start:2727 stop:2960 length:234 start_codon:yes stop_codon:yes gene_type:complete